MGFEMLTYIETRVLTLRSQPKVSWRFFGNLRKDGYSIGF